MFEVSDCSEGVTPRKNVFTRHPHKTGWEVSRTESVNDDLGNEKREHFLSLLKKTQSPKKFVSDYVFSDG